MAIKVFGALIVMLVSLVLCEGKISCMDSNGNPVDWFVVYKLPRDKDNPNHLIQDGVAHMYMDVNKQDFVLSQVSLNDSRQSVGYTLQQIYDNDRSADVVYMMYDDEFPDGRKTDSYGHTKGDIAFDQESGFWLIHSVPKFPDYAKYRYSWPDNALPYGQSMLCITMKSSEFVKVGKQLTFNHPWVFDYNIPASFQSQYSDFVAVSKGQHVTQPPWNNSVILTSQAGQEFTSFAKYTSFGKDLYSYWIAPALGDDLYAETWENSASKLPSYCDGMYKVENVYSVNFVNVQLFKETKDHSKWAICQHKKWTCIGDINRTGSQFERGGGTVCATMPAVWNAFSAAIQSVDKCPSD